MKKQNYILIAIVIFLIALLNSFFIVNEREQAIITQFGKPIGDAKVESGLYFKTPFVQTVLKFDKRILEWDGAANEIPTKDNKYIFVDTFARWKITNPLQFYKSARNEMLAQSRLDDIIDGAVRDEISNRFMSEIVRSTDREMGVYDSELGNNNSDEIIKGGARKAIIASILISVDSKLEELNLGISVVDFQIKRMSYNRQVQDKLFNRMISEQNMIAEKYRAQGEGKKQEILGIQKQKEKEILSEAYKKSQKIRGEADAKAIKIYADSYNQDPKLYEFIRSLDAYEKVLDSSTKLILSTDSKFLKYLK